MAEKSLFRATNWISLALGLFLFLTGLGGLLDFNSQGAEFARGFGAAFGADKGLQLLPAVIAVLEIAAGAVLILAPWGILQPSLVRIILLVVTILWAVKIVYFHFIAVKPFTPSVLSWLSMLSLDLVLLTGLWAVLQGNDAKN